MTWISRGRKPIRSRRRRLCNGRIRIRFSQIPRLPSTNQGNVDEEWRYLQRMGSRGESKARQGRARFRAVPVRDTVLRYLDLNARTPGRVLVISMVVKVSREPLARTQGVSIHFCCRLDGYGSDPYVRIDRFRERLKICNI